MLTLTFLSYILRTSLKLQFETSRTSGDKCKTTFYSDEKINKKQHICLQLCSISSHYHLGEKKRHFIVICLSYGTALRPHTCQIPAERTSLPTSSGQRKREGQCSLYKQHFFEEAGISRCRYTRWPGFP